MTDAFDPGQYADSLNIGPSPTGRGFRLEAVQFLPRPPREIFDFFSDAHNLESLTPPWLNFAVLANAPITIGEGTIIHYRLKLHGIPLRWQSEIVDWDPPRGFRDVQLRGPYRWWRHEHRFEEVDGGTLCHDVVDYAVLGGRIVNALVVRPDVRRIFAYRQQKLRELFPARGA